MYRNTLMTILLLVGSAQAATFEPLPYLVDGQVDVLNRQVTNQLVDRDLFAAPYATVIVGNVDVYDHFPYLEARYFQVVSDPGWNRLVFGEVDRGLQAFDGTDTELGALRGPRGLATDTAGLVYVADTDNNRVVVLRAVTEFDRMTLTPVYAITGLNQPHDVAWSDGGTPFTAGDDALYVANTGRNEVLRYGLGATEAHLTSRLGALGSGPGEFAGPLAVTVGRSEGACTGEVYVADAHNERLVRLADSEGALAWAGEVRHGRGALTSLTSDHFGNVYATGPAGGVVKYTAGLKAVAGSLPATHRPRSFHVPSVTVTDHRTGVRSRSGEGRGILVEEWGTGSGLRVMGLGVEIQRPAQVAGAAAVDLFLTDAADVTAELSDPATGAVVAVRRAGRLAAGPARVELQAVEGEAGWEAGSYLLTLRAASTYDGDRSAEVQLTVDLARAGDPDLPRSLKLVGNAPNPFNPTTTISFLVPAGATAAPSLKVYDTRGRLVRHLDAGGAAPGLHQVLWDGRDDSGEPVGSGIYLYRVVVGAEKAAGKMVLLK